MFSPFDQFKQPRQRPCVRCGKLTFNKEWIPIHPGKRPAELAVCADGCLEQTNEAQARKDRQSERQLKKIMRRAAHAIQ